MRKIILCFFMSMAAIGCFAQKGISVDELTLSPGETGQLVINLTQDEGEFCAFQFDLYLPDGVEIISVNGEKWSLNTDRIESTNGNPHVINDINKNGFKRFVVFSMSGSRGVFIGTAGPIIYINVKASDDHAIGTQTVSVKNAQLTFSANLSTTFMQDDFTYTFTCQEEENDYLLGDVNDDGVVDNADFIATLRYTLGQVPSFFNEDAADVNQDGSIDNADAIKILRMTIN